MSLVPRGIRNNNPGNIDRTATPWLGEVVPGQDPRFATFDTMAHGVRALAKLMLTYHDVHGCTSVRQIINRWAPPTENNTTAYVDDVAKQCHVDPDADFPVHTAGSLLRLVWAIIDHENGTTAANMVSGADVTTGVNLALGL